MTSIDAAFVTALADRAVEAEELRRLPADTVADFRASGLANLLLPARYGGRQADFPAILDPIRMMAHGCPSSAWTLGFYILHNWMLALFEERAQDEVFAAGPVLCPAPLAPTGRGVPVDGGVRLTGRWSWATGVMDADWIMVGALCGADSEIYPALALLPMSDVEVLDVWHTAGMRATGSNDVVVTDVVVPEHRLAKVIDIYGGTAPGAALHDAATYRWPLVPALALVAAMPALGAAESVADLFARRLSERVLAYSGVAQRTSPPPRSGSGMPGCDWRRCVPCWTTPSPESRTRWRAGPRCRGHTGRRPAPRPRTSCTNPVQ